MITQYSLWIGTTVVRVPGLPCMWLARLLETGFIVLNLNAMSQLEKPYQRVIFMVETALYGSSARKRTRIAAPGHMTYKLFECFVGRLGVVMTIGGHHVTALSAIG